VVGNRTRVKVAKNKLAPPFREVEFDILYGHGISHSGDVLDLGVEAGIVEKSGSWYSFGEERIGQGREKTRAHLEAHPDLLERISNLVREKHGLGSAPDTGAPKIEPEPSAADSAEKKPVIAIANKPPNIFLIINLISPHWLAKV